MMQPSPLDDFGLPHKDSSDAGLLWTAVLRLRQELTAEAQLLLERWRGARPLPAHPGLAAGLCNLAAQVALQGRDLGALQHALAAFGLSIRKCAAGEVAEQLDVLARTLSLLAGPAAARAAPAAGAAAPAGAQLLSQNGVALFGRPPLGRGVRILVTLPREAATSYEFVRQLLVAGMDCARIDCAHDDTAIWEAMIANLRRAARSTGCPCRLYMDLPGSRVRIAQVALPRKEERIRQGARLLLTRRAARLGKSGGAVDAVMTTTLGSALPQLALGAEVGIDGGRLTAQVSRLEEEGMLLQVVYAPPRGLRLKPAQTLHFPGQDLELPTFTEKEMETLRFILAHADILGCSFIRSVEALAERQRQIRVLGRELGSLGLILKMETAAAVQNLPVLLANALGEQPVAVLVAQSDLAAEFGFAEAAARQDEVLQLCQAADVPVLCTAPVLQRLAEKGTSTRAELADAAAAQRAACIQLDRGRFVLQAVQTLDHVLLRLQQRQASRWT